MGCSDTVNWGLVREAGIQTIAYRNPNKINVTAYTQHRDGNISFWRLITDDEGGPLA